MTRPKNLLAMFLLAVLACGVASAIRPLAAAIALQDRPLTEQPISAMRK
jgi:hypothetical protein